MRNSYKLLGVLQSFAPDRAAQEVCSQMYRGAQAAGCSEKELVETMAGALTDGLRYGNWVWLLATSPFGDAEEVTSPVCDDTTSNEQLLTNLVVNVEMDTTTGEDEMSERTKQLRDMVLARMTLPVEPKGIEV